MAQVELLYFPGCPNVPAARTQLRRALLSVGRPPRWREIDVTSPSAPERTRGYGSPTILVTGRDVTGDPPGSGESCRLYSGGAPAADVIVAALRAAGTAKGALGLAVLPGAVLSLLPVVSCPACWPAYASLLGALGVPFLLRAAWLLPITVAALVVALAGLAHGAWRQRRPGPLVVGGAAAFAILAGKFLMPWDPAVFAGTALLLGASIWTSRPRRAVPECDACHSEAR